MPFGRQRNGKVTAGPASKDESLPEFYPMQLDLPRKVNPEALMMNWLVQLTGGLRFFDDMYRKAVRFY